MKLTAILLACAAAAAQAAPIPAEQFFRRADLTGATMSPDGRRMLSVLDVESHAYQAVANFDNADVGNFYWLSDMRLAYTLINVDHDGAIDETRLNAVDRDGKDFITLTTTIVTQSSFADNDNDNINYVAQPTVGGFPTYAAEVIYVVALEKTGTMLGRLDSRRNQFTYVPVPAGSRNWLMDASGELCLAVAQRNGKQVVFHRTGDDWRELAMPQSFMPKLCAGGKLYVRTNNGNDETSIYRFDLDKKALESRPLITIPGFDADGYFQLDDHKILGFRTTTEAATTVWFDDTMKAVQSEIDALLPATINTLGYGERSAKANILVDAYSDIQNHTYFLYNRDTKKLLRFGSTYPHLPAEQMTPMLSERYPARDGLRIPIYLTVPEPERKRPHPTVVLVGDPSWRRSASWQWNAEVQFLASRGYTVLQPQPRGTDGFGSAFTDAGDKQWGRAIQDDIADAVKWAAAQGYTDPARVCIAGTGYGGYAAMMGLIRDPALFKCGISWSGITDIGAMFERDWKGMVDQSFLPQLRARIGDPKRDAAQLRETSPLYNAARITQPVLLAYGRRDARVPLREGRKFRDALAATNQQVEWVEYNPGVDDWKTQASRIDLWRRIETFLSKEIGP